MKVLVIGDPHGKLPLKLPKKVDLILITGDIGKADLARKHSFLNSERRKKDLPKKEYTPKQERLAYMEIYNSTLQILKRLSKIAPVYSILGNVGTRTDYGMKKDEKKLGIKLPYLRLNMNNIKNFHLVRNSIRNINGLKIGFLEYFLDIGWVREFKPGDYKKSLRKAKKETDKAKKILRWFVKQKIDILLCHQPPYDVLDKVTWKEAPKHYLGKHAGSKVILNFIKEYEPKYVFCGHIHEGKGKKKIGKTIVINAGVSGDYLLLNIN